jgi:hypothetical protein
VGEHPPAEQHRNLVGIDRVVLGLTAVNGFHVQGMAEDAGHPLLGTEVREPVPREETFDRDHDILAVGRNDLEPAVWVGLQMTMHQELPVSVQDADVHRPGVPVDAPVKLLWLGVESHEVSSASVGCLPSASSPTVVCRGGGLNKYQR